MVCLQCGMTTFQFLETKTQIQAHNGIRVIKQGRSRKTLSLSPYALLAQHFGGGAVRLYPSRH